MPHTRQRRRRWLWPARALVAVTAVVAVPAAGSASASELPTLRVTAAGVPGDAYSWSIAKTADTDEVVLGPGRRVTVGYTVVATPTLVPGGWAARGELHVRNDHHTTVLLDPVAVEVEGVGPAEVSCPEGLPAVLAADQVMTCEWSAALPDDAVRVATASAVLNGVEHVETATIEFRDAAAVAAATDECADVHDLNVGFLGTVCAEDGPATFAFPVEFGPFEECPARGLENLAWLETADTHTVSEAAWLVRVVCDWPPGDENVRTYLWRIEKSVVPASVVLGPGERATIAYAVTVASAGYTDSNPGAPVTAEVDECVDVTDSEVEELGTVCIGEAPHTFAYTIVFGPYEECGPRTIPNTATYRGTDTGASGDAVAVLEIDVLC